MSFLRDIVGLTLRFLVLGLAQGIHEDATRRERQAEAIPLRREGDKWVPDLGEKHGE